MKIDNIKNFINGWFIGDFDPSILKTKDFEIGIKFFKKNQKPDVHFHKIATEYNYIIKGEVIINNKKLKEKDMFILYPNEIVNAKFLKNCQFLVIKVPSIKGDKYKI